MSRLDAVYFINFRRDHRMKKSDLARVLGVSVDTVRRIESGKVTPSVQTMRKFEALLEKHAH